MLPAGQPLPSQRDLSKKLGVSRATLREALSVIETMGWISTEPRKRAVVAKVEDENSEGAGQGWKFHCSASDIFEFRFVIESQIAGIAAMKASDSDIAALRRNAREFKEAVDAADLSLIMEKDREFHRIIVDCTGNLAFQECYANYAKPFLDTHKMELNQLFRLQELIIEHDNIINSIEFRDPTRAAYFMRIHIMRAADRSGISMQKTPLAL